jgi:hypothetical protein
VEESNHHGNGADAFIPERPGDGHGHYAPEPVDLIDTEVLSLSRLKHTSAVSALMAGTVHLMPNGLRDMPLARSPYGDVLQVP